MPQQELLALRLKLRRGYAGLPRRHLCIRAPQPATEAESSTQEDDGVGVKRSPRHFTEIELIKKIILNLPRMSRNDGSNATANWHFIRAMKQVERLCGAHRGRAGLLKQLCRGARPADIIQDVDVCVLPTTLDGRPIGFIRSLPQASLSASRLNEAVLRAFTRTNCDLRVNPTVILKTLSELIPKFSEHPLFYYQVDILSTLLCASSPCLTPFPSGLKRDFDSTAKCLIAEDVQCLYFF